MGDGSKRSSPAERGRAQAGSDPAAANGLQMSPQAMLDLAQRAAEVLVRRHGNLAGEGAWDGEFRAELSERLMEDPPEGGSPPAEVMDRAVHEVLPWALSLDHPRSFGFVSSCPTWPGVVADFLAAAYNINSCNWLISSGPSQLECVVIEWFRGWLGYPETAGGVLTSGGSAASLDAVVAAREAAGHPRRATVYMSDQSHSAHQKAVKIVGIRPDRARLVPSDDRFRIDMDALTRMGGGGPLRRTRAHRQRTGIGRAGRRIHRCQSGSRVSEPGLAERRVLPGQSVRPRHRGRGPGRDQSQGAGTPFLGGVPSRARARARHGTASRPFAILGAALGIPPRKARRGSGSSPWAS